MPEIAFKKISVQYLLKGDTISTTNDGSWPYGAVVDTVVTKVKWVTVRDVNGNLIRRAEVGTMVTIEREVPTEAEAKALGEQIQTKLVTEWVEATREELNKAKARTIDYITRNVATGSTYQNLEIARVRYTFAARIVKRQADEGMSILSAAQLECELAITNMLCGYNDPNSSGGFTMENAARWIEHTQLRTIIRELRFNGGFDGTGRIF